MRKGSLSGKVVCITGAGRGLGASLARGFAAEGAHLVLGARTTPEIDALASGRAPIYRPLDRPARVAAR